MIPNNPKAAATPPSSIGAAARFTPTSYDVRNLDVRPPRPANWGQRRERHSRPAKRTTRTAPKASDPAPPSPAVATAIVKAFADPATWQRVPCCACCSRPLKAGALCPACAWPADPSEVEDLIADENGAICPTDFDLMHALCDACGSVVDSGTLGLSERDWTFMCWECPDPLEAEAALALKWRAKRRRGSQ
jgi:hypothetical protein